MAPHTLVAQGEIIDEGAEKALMENGASLLSSGIVDVQGDFDRGDAVVVRSANNTDALAKGICQYNSHELLHIKGQQTEDIAEQFGYSPNYRSNSPRRFNDFGGFMSQQLAEQIAQRATKAARAVATLSEQDKNNVLQKMADAIRNHKDNILK